MREGGFLKRPFGVSFISYFYIFGACVLLFTSIFYDSGVNPFSVAERFGLANAPEQLVRIVVAIISLIMAFGYLGLKKWGFWFMMIYSLLFGTLSLSLAISHNQQPFIGNAIFSVIIIIYTLYVKNAFFQPPTTAGETGVGAY